jgi:hypothetical protein
MPLAGFGLRQGERLVYEYDFYDAWRHDIRLEQTAAVVPGRCYPVCTGGARTAPPTEGAFVCLAGLTPHVSLARHHACDRCGHAMFEFGTCRRCGEVYLHGTIDGGRLRPRKADDPAPVWVTTGDSAAWEDDDDKTLGDEDTSFADHTDAWLCLTCAALHTGAGPRCGLDGCDGKRVRVRRLKATRTTPGACLTCGRRGRNTIRLFETGSGPRPPC